MITCWIASKLPILNKLQLYVVLQPSVVAVMCEIQLEFLYHM